MAFYTLSKLELPGGGACQCLPFSDINPATHLTGNYLSRVLSGGMLSFPASPGRM